MLVAPVAERNKELILEVLADCVDNTSQAFGLELASGTGQHVVHFAQALPNVTWQPSEISLSARESISFYIRATKVQNVKELLATDVSQPWEHWAGLGQGCCNVIVIINLELVHDVGQLLKPRGVCLIYGPFASNGIISPACNAELHEKLQGK